LWFNLIIILNLTLQAGRVNINTTKGIKADYLTKYKY
jgi:hypothetical protein